MLALMWHLYGMHEFTHASTKLRERARREGGTVHAIPIFFPAAHECYILSGLDLESQLCVSSTTAQVARGLNTIPSRRQWKK